MSIRHALLALALAVAGLAAGGATVLADDEHDVRRELHVVRRHDPVVIDRTGTLDRLDRLLEGIEEIAALTPSPGRGHGHGRWLRDDGREDARGAHDDDDRDERERPGAQPVERGELRHAPPPVAGRLVEERLDDMRREVLLLRREVLRAPEVVRERRRVIVPMEERAFELFVRDLRRAPFARDKVAIVEDVVVHAHFTSEQAEIVVRVVEAWGQVDAAVALYPRVVDPESFHRVVGALTFRSDREELRERIRR